jgi:hypothetical protein
MHSYLILAYSDGDRVAMHVGFYYMANAAGRLLGTLLSRHHVFKRLAWWAASGPQQGLHYRRALVLPAHGTPALTMELRGQ